MEKNQKKSLNLNCLPNNIFAEQSILNLLLTHPNIINNIISSLPINSFYYEPYKIIYQQIYELVNENKIITVTHLITKLQDKNLLNKIGGISQITSLLDKYENISELENYIIAVNEKYLRRLIIELGKEIIKWGFTLSENIEDILGKIENSIFELNQQKKINKLISTAEIVDSIFEELKTKIKEDTNNNNGLESSFKDLDSILQGFQKSDLIIIAGRPSMGKTAFALNLGKNIVSTYKIPLIIFSLEMSRQQIVYRFISSDSNINFNRIKSGKMNANEWKKLTESMQNLANLPIFIDDNPNLSISEIRTKLKKIFIDQRKNGLIIIDYLQLMNINFKLDNRSQEISFITRNLKILAKEFELPIILLSQLSRNVESRINKRPLLSDLRESGCISQRNTSLNKKEKIKSWTKRYLLYLNQSIDYSIKGKKPTFEITLTNFKKLIFTANHRILSEKGWTKISELTKDSNIYSLKKDTFYFFNFEKIIKIEYKGLQKVYDRTIPYTHNYIKKNIVLHNSIEQDADIVIMLYREQYYTDKNTNPHITEFIIAKHRNGPIGTAKLLFSPTTTKFTNLETPN